MYVRHLCNYMSVTTHTRFHCTRSSLENCGIAQLASLFSSTHPSFIGSDRSIQRIHNTLHSDHKLASVHELLNPPRCLSLPAPHRDKIPIAAVLSLRTIARNGRPQLVEICCVCNAPAAACCKAQNTASPELSVIAVETLSMQWFPSFSSTVVVDRRVPRSPAQLLSPSVMHSTTSFWYA